ncbi:MAG: AAA family ATPase [Sedimentisphaerales bacterium]|nr:AAA family ATPase [Sedimentisphaerales bacterium]
MENAISKLTIKGYKSIRNLENFELRNINILIGPNGSGKSNFIDFFYFLRELSKGRLQHFVEYQGGADKILYLGSKVTKELISSIESSNERVFWELKLFTSKVDKLLFYEEKITGDNSSLSVKWAKEYEHGLSESDLFSKTNNAELNEYNEKIKNRIQSVIESWIPYHFHDTSDFAKIKIPSSQGNYDYLFSDGSNLAPFLFRIKEKQHSSYQAIIDVIRLAVPFFDDLSFDLNNEIGQIQWWWKQKSLINPDYKFHPSQISDGTLRFICLATSLLQPEPPSLILLDEPELGLHPMALALLAEMVKKASLKTQIIVATQSASLISHFEPEDIVIVERKDEESVFRRLPLEKLKQWLDDYSLGELWEMHLLEGRPENE